jgi:arsenite/tail-anchored protein-transporting ATPase
VLRTSQVEPERVKTPLMRLQDPDHTRILLVALPESTPVTEAARLQEDLRRAGIEPFAWVVNQSLAATDTTDPVLAARARGEAPLIERIRTTLARRLAVVPLLPKEPVGAAGLRRLARGAERIGATAG